MEQPVQTRMSAVWIMADVNTPVLTITVWHNLALVMSGLNAMD